jgi:hypothetical protein
VADTCVQYTFGSLTVNATSGDTLHTDFEGGDIQGLDGAPIRKQIDPQGQSDGGIVHAAFFGPRVITFTGKVLIRSVADISDSAYIAAVNAVISNAKSALEAQLNSAATLSWTETGGGAHSISCTYGTEGGEFQTSGNMLEKSFSFTLVAADPTIS